jgi:hypothetical protein
MSPPGNADALLSAHRRWIEGDARSGNGSNGAGSQQAMVAAKARLMLSPSILDSG